MGTAVVVSAILLAVPPAAGPAGWQFPAPPPDPPFLPIASATGLDGE